MPQMMPLNWLSMFLSINMIMVMFMIINFNLFIPTSPKMDLSKIGISTHKWMW